MAHQPSPGIKEPLGSATSMEPVPITLTALRFFEPKTPPKTSFPYGISGIMNETGHPRSCLARGGGTENGWPLSIVGLPVAAAHIFALEGPEIGLRVPRIHALIGLASSMDTLSSTILIQQSAFALPSMTMPSQPAIFRFTPNRYRKFPRLYHSIG